MLLNLNGWLTHNNFQESNNFIGTMDVQAGYAFFDNFFFGVKYSPTYIIDFSEKSRFNIPAYGIFSRYYFFKNKNRIYLQTDFNQSIGASSVGLSDGNISAGIARFLSQNAALELRFNYNYYNKTLIQVGFPGSQGDPIFDTKNKPTGLDISLGVNFFLPSNPEKTFKPERLPLAERYLKKGNRYLHLSGQIDYKNIGFLGSFEQSKFIGHGLRLVHRFFGFGSFGKDVRKAGIGLYLPSLEKYIPLGDRLFFAPSAGLGQSLAFFDVFDSSSFGWGGTAQAGLNYFFDNSILSTGITFYVFDSFSSYNDVVTTSNLFLSAEFFISEKLAIRPIAYYNIHGDSIPLFFFENGRFPSSRMFRLQFGMSYYY